MDVDLERAAKIAALNDRFRGMAIDVMITPGVRDLPQVIELMKAVEQFDKFNEDNDPYGEHDFGSLEWYDEKIFWKIDYYDKELKYGRDPLNNECRRIMTVMLASEY
jgi:hypothetical protein